MPKARIRIMLSYNYSHFEVELSTDEDLNIKQIRQLRSQTQQLAAEAVEEYRRSKEVTNKLLSRDV